jgi:hypothetical protein
MTRNQRYRPRLRIDEGSSVTIDFRHDRKKFSLVNFSQHGFLIENHDNLDIETGAKYPTMVYITGKHGNLTFQTECTILQTIDNKVAAGIELSKSNKLIFDEFIKDK